MRIYVVVLTHPPLFCCQAFANLSRGVIDIDHRYNRTVIFSVRLQAQILGTQTSVLFTGVWSLLTRSAYRPQMSRRVRSWSSPARARGPAHLDRAHPPSSGSEGVRTRLLADLNPP